MKSLLLTIASLLVCVYGQPETELDDSLISFNKLPPHCRPTMPNPDEEFRPEYWKPNPPNVCWGEYCYEQPRDLPNIPTPDGRPPWFVRPPIYDNGKMVCEPPFVPKKDRKMYGQLVANQAPMTIVSPLRQPGMAVGMGVGVAPAVVPAAVGMVGYDPYYPSYSGYAYGR